MRLLERQPLLATLREAQAAAGRVVFVAGEAGIGKSALVRSLCDADIAARLHIPPKTGDHHVSAIPAKPGVGSRQEAARWARHGPGGRRDEVTQ